jgi:Fur family zinc uptake transcriptional regulator
MKTPGRYGRVGAASPARETSPASNDDEILRVLRSSSVPMTAYAILEAVRSRNITAPTTVYRALSRLMQRGTVHRLESLNAYIACRDHCHQHGPAAFIICRGCGHVDELTQTDVVRRLQADATRLGFQIEATTIELTGRCASCAAA